MKTITQADLSDLSDKYTWLAINKHGDLHGYEEKPVPCDTVSGYEYQRTAIWLGKGYDTSEWEASAIRRGSEATNKEKLESLVSDINNNIDLLVDAFSKDTGISVNDVYVELSVECYDSSLDE